MKIAYLMSRFPKLTETFVLFEMIAVKKLGIPIEVYPLFREKTKVVHPEAKPFIRTAHFFPFLSKIYLPPETIFLTSSELSKVAQPKIYPELAIAWKFPFLQISSINHPFLVLEMAEPVIFIVQELSMIELTAVGFVLAVRRIGYVLDTETILHLQWLSFAAIRSGVE